MPDSVGLHEAAALLHDGPTALGLAERAQLQPGDWVLVLGAGGGMGLLLLQLAHAAQACPSHSPSFPPTGTVAGNDPASSPVMR